MILRQQLFVLVIACLPGVWACGTPSMMPEKFSTHIYPRTGLTPEWSAATTPPPTADGQTGASSALQPPRGALTLDDCVRLALANNPAITQADLAIAEAENQNSYAWQTWVPRLTMIGRVSYRSNAPEIEFMGQRFAVQDRFESNATVRATSDVIGFGRTVSGLKATQRWIDGATAHKRITQHQLVAAVIRQYFLVLNLRRQIDLLGETIKTVEAQALDARAFFEQGLATENEPLIAEVALAERIQARIEAETAILVALSRLNTLMGLDPRRETAVHDVPLGDIRPPAVDSLIDPATAMQLALQNRPDILAAKANAEAAAGEAEYYDWARWPLFSVFAEYSVSGARNVVNNHWGTIGAEMSWTIFDVQANTTLKSAEIRADRAEAQRLEVERNVMNDVQSAYLKLRDAQKRVAVTAQRIAQAEANLRIVQAQFRALPGQAGRDAVVGGLATSADVLQAEALRSAAIGDRFRAQYDELQAWADLEWAMGVRFAVHDWAAAGREIAFPRAAADSGAGADANRRGD